MPRRRNDLPELMPKEVGTKQQVPRILWKLVQYWACLAAFLTPKRKPLAMTGKLILVNCTYWDCDTHHYLMRIKNCHQALAEEGTPTPAKVLVGKPPWQISWLPSKIFWQKMWREPHICECHYKVCCVREPALLYWWSPYLDCGH